MSVHIEWMEARQVRVDAHRKGEVMADGNEITADFALALSMDEAYVVEGTYAELTAILQRAWNALQEQHKDARRQS